LRVCFAAPCFRAARVFGRAEEEMPVPEELSEKREQLLAALQLGDTKAIGSVGGKVATILRGETDLYISLSGRSAPKDWDMAAPDAVLRAAGGSFTHADGRVLTYNTGDVRQAGCLIASHGPSHGQLCERAAAAMAAIDPGFAV
jgi:3'(2'), 5'-bisphosphate nucleotidase